MPTGIRPPAEGAPYVTVPMVDFRGGLNRTRDTPEVEANEVMDISNWDLDPGGGLSLRAGTKRAVQNQTAQTGSIVTGRSISNMGYYGDSQGGTKLLMGRGESAAGQIWCPTSGTLRTLTGTNAAHFYRLAGYTIILAHPAATHNAIRIPDDDILSGTITTMSEAYEDDYEFPTTEGHPPARYGCTQHYRAWVVDESLVNRVRFSHPNDPLHWHSDDWIDVGPISSDIVGLYPLGDVVLCVKQDSVWYIQGDVLSAMRLRRLDEDISAQFSDAYEVRPSVEGMGQVWIWDKSDGLISISPNLQVTKHADKLMRFGKVPGVASISYSDSKIYCWSNEFDVTYVYDARGGGWTIYSYSMSEVTEVTLGTYGSPGETIEVFLDEDNSDGSGHNYVMVFDEDESTDVRGATPTTTDVTTTVRTPWLVGQGPTEPDKWGRPRFLIETIDDETDLSGNIVLRKNLEETTVSTAAWTLDESEEGRVKNVRGPSGGRGETVSYTLTLSGGRAYLHSMVARFKPKRIRR